MRHFITAWWRKRQRRIDREYLFPLIYDGAETHRAAEHAICEHIRIDAAWQHAHEWYGESGSEQQAIIHVYEKHLNRNT